MNTPLTDAPESNDEAPQHLSTTLMTGVVESSSRDPGQIAQGARKDTRGTPCQCNCHDDGQQASQQPSAKAVRAPPGPNVVRKARPEEKAESSLMGGLGAAVGSILSRKQHDDSEQLHQRDEIIRSLRQQLRARPTIQSRNKFFTENDELKKENAGLRRARDSFHQAARQLGAELRDEKQHVLELENDIKEQEDVITKAHSSAFDLLAQDVSTTFPDDKIRRELRRLFEDDVFGWALDFSLPKLQDPGSIKLLTERGILADETRVPAAYRMSLEADTTSAVLLMAALATDLCDSFLRNPFVLGGGWLTMDTDRIKRKSQIA